MSSLLEEDEGGSDEEGRGGEEGTDEVFLDLLEGGSEDDDGEGREAAFSSLFSGGDAEFSPQVLASRCLHHKNCKKMIGQYM